MPGPPPEPGPPSAENRRADPRYVFSALGPPSLVTSFADHDRLDDAIRRVRPRVVYFEVVTNP